MRERLQKLIARAGICSRRTAETLLTAGRVTVNGVAAQLGDKADAGTDVIAIDGTTIAFAEPSVYLMLNKPRGYVTTLSDELGRATAAELVADCGTRVFPVGRLDKDSEGLLLLTNDGEFANLMTHPSHGVSKLYRVTVRPRATEEQVVALSQGVELDDGTRTQPAVINVVTDEPERTVLEMTIREGKNREIRRMCEAVGLDVIRLRRNAMGAVKLGMLQPGEYRELTKSELNALRAAGIRGVSRPKPEEAAKKPARRPAEGAKRGPRAAGSRPGARPTGRPGSGKGPARGPKKPGSPRG